MKAVAGALLLVTILAGCADAPKEGPEPSAPEPQTADPRGFGNRASDPAPESIEEDRNITKQVWGNATTKLLGNGAARWHGNPTQGINAYNQVAQAVAHPCVWQPQEIYFTNQFLGTVRIPYGTDALAITYEWDPESYLRDALRAGYRFWAGDNYSESQPFGGQNVLELKVDSKYWSSPTNGTGPSFEFWACLDTDTGEGLFPPSIFVGEVRYSIEALRT